MTATIDATVGGATANSYGTLAEGNSYFEGRTNCAEWTDATDTVKKAALITATWKLDAESYSGYRATSTQALRWPRIGAKDDEGFYIVSTLIPAWLKIAQFELALWLLQNEDPEITALRDRFTQLDVDTLSLHMNRLTSFGLPGQIARILRGTIMSSGQTMLLRS